MLQRVCTVYRFVFSQGSKAIVKLSEPVSRTLWKFYWLNDLVICCLKSGVVFWSLKSNNSLTRHSRSGKHYKFGHVIELEKCHTVARWEAYISFEIYSILGRVWVALLFFLFWLKDNQNLHMFSLRDLHFVLRPLDHDVLRAQLRNIKRAPCLYSLMQTREGVWENSKVCVNPSRIKYMTKVALQKQQLYHFIWISKSKFTIRAHVYE